MSRVTLKNVSKSFNRKDFVVHDFNLEIKDKEFVVFVGPSGCGKSTTLRMIAGLEEISSGEIYIDDKLVNDVPPKDRNISMVFQNYALYPHMTVKKNMSFGLKLKKLPKDIIEEKIERAAKILDIEQYLNRKPKDLSGGQRQRVALGRAMVRDASVFLLDEPLSNLDAKLRNHMRAEISKLHEVLKTTFIYVTHDQTEAITMGDRIVVMKSGKIQQADTPKELYESPNSIFVASFIGSPQMNFFDAVILEKDGNFCVKIKDFVLPLSKNRATNLKEYINKKVVVGIRPENFRSEQTFAPSFKNNIFEASIDYVELTGSDYHIHFNFQGFRTVAKISTTNLIRKGDKVRLAVSHEKIHVFDRETEMQILS